MLWPIGASFNNRDLLNQHLIYMAWVGNYIHITLWDVTNHSCPSFNGGKLGRGWIITSHIKLCNNSPMWQSSLNHGRGSQRPGRPLTSLGTSAWPYRVTTQYSYCISSIPVDYLTSPCHQQAWHWPSHCKPAHWRPVRVLRKGSFINFWIIFIENLYNPQQNHFK